MRRIIMSAVLVAGAVVLQLTTINGLRLPGGGVPDLVLVVVAALGLAGGPVQGAIAGFAAGLCLDLAPPGSGVAGVYALVFCLVGWACGRFRATLARSALLPMVIAATAAVLGEIMIAALGMALQPAQVSWTSVRQVLPAALFWDVAVSPFVLYLVLLAGAWLDEASAGPAAAAGQARLRRAQAQGSSLAGGPAGAGRQGLAGPAGPAGSAGGAVLLGLGGWLAGPPQSRRARKAAARLTPRLGPGSRRAGDGWIGGSAAARRALGGQALGSRALRNLARDSRPHGSGSSRLRSGVAGSAAGGQVPRTLAARPVHLRLASGRKRDGAVGNMLGAGRSMVTGGALGRGSLAGLGRRRRGRGDGFRPSAMPGGSAVTGPPRRTHLVPAPMVRFGSSRRRDGVVGGGALTRLSQAGRRPAGRRPAAPRFRIRPDPPARGAGAGLAAGSGSGPQTLQSVRRQVPPPRLRMHPRRGDGVLGGPLAGGGPGAGGGPAAGGGRMRTSSRPATPRFRARPLAGGRPVTGKRPRFGYRRWSILWLLPKPQGGRLRMWRIGGRRTGGSR